MGWMTRIQFPVGARIFLFATIVTRLAVGPTPASYVMGMGALFPVGKLVLSV
jgi:hypothetical protein